MSVNTHNTQETLSTKTRAERLLIDLEKLKKDIAGIESRYGVLSANYTTLCEDAISQLNSLKKQIDIPHKSTKQNQQELTTKIQNLEARFRLGLIPQEIYLSQKQKLAFRYQPSTGLQLVIDKAADGIEYGLDKLGNGLVLPIVLVANAYSGIRKLSHK